MAKQRPYTGRAVSKGLIRFTSVSQIKLYDKKSDGCPRKWWFQYVDGKRLEKTDALDAGIEAAGKLEHFLKTGENVLLPVLQPAQKFFPEPRNPRTGELDLEVEQPLGSDFATAVTLRDEFLRFSAQPPTPFNKNAAQSFLPEIQRLAGLTACGIPLDGAADFRHTRGSYKNEDGVETAEHPSTRVVEIGDLKLISRINPQRVMSGKNAGTVLPGWAKTAAQVCDDVQMVAYGRHAVDRYPDASHVRLSHVYAQKSSKGAAKRTGLISREEVLKRYRRIEDLVGQMSQVAGGHVKDVEYNSLACDSFNHVDPHGSGQMLRGCGHRYYCPLPEAVSFQNLFGESQEKESTMSLFNTLPKGMLGAELPSAPPPPPAPQPPVPPAPPPDLAAEREAVEKYKAQLRAEDEARRTGGQQIQMKLACGAPGCGVGCSPGWVKGDSPGGFFRCTACNGEGLKVSAATVAAVEAPPLPPPAPPAPPPHPMAVTPPDAPPPAPLLHAAAPLPPAAVAEITDPALKAVVEEHAKEHARLAAEKERQEAEEKMAAGTAIWCKESPHKDGRLITPTMEQALEGKYVCTCTKTYSLKSMKQEDGTYLLKRHKPIVKEPVAEAPNGAAAAAVEAATDDDDLDDETVVYPPPPPPLGLSSTTTTVSPPPPPPPPPVASSVPNGNGMAKEPPITWSTPTIITLLRSIDASLREIVKRGEKL